MDRNATTRRGIGGEAAEMLRKNIRNYAMYIALAVIFIVFQILSRGAFLTARNITNLINQTGYIAVMAVGMTLVLIICQIDGHEAGALCKVLEEFAFRDVNMTRIESRPARTELGAYIFFFDLETRGVTEEALRASIEGCRARSIWLRNLGAFPVLEAAI